jgi:SAM-dependent methyltransferase
VTKTGFSTTIPSDRCQQVTDRFFFEEAVDLLELSLVVDLGCGAGNSVDYFRSKNPAIEWIGVDVESSPEVNTRNRTDAAFRTFDGVHIPFDDETVDLIYCHQVLEHVRFPNDLLRDVSRVLKPGGYLVGSTSHLEPYHSYSHQNFTPYGFYTRAKFAGLNVTAIRPGIDAITLISRRLLGRPRIFGRYFEKESPLNQVIEWSGRLLRKSNHDVNEWKLLFCGHFAFLCQRPILKQTAEK